MKALDVTLGLQRKAEEIYQLQVNWGSQEAILRPLIEALGDIEPVRFYFDEYGLTIGVSGDSKLLLRCLSTFLSQGFRYFDKPPTAPITSWHAFFYYIKDLEEVPEEAWEIHDSVPKVWFDFTSKTCVRVQVGTKMVEQPVYETQCTEDSEAERLAAETDDSIPS